MVIKYVTALSHIKILASDGIQKQYEGGREGRTGSLGLLISIFKNILPYNIWRKAIKASFKLWNTFL